MHRTILALAALASWAPALAAQDFTWSRPLEAGRTLAVEGLNGEIAVSRASGGEARVTAVTRVRRGSGADVRVEAHDTERGVVFCAVYPWQKPKGDEPCHFSGSADGWSRKNDVSVDFTVELPAGVQLAAENVNGSIRATGLASDVVAKTVNGGVEVSTSGSARAETVNGSLIVAVGRASGPMELETVNGGITVTLPENLGMTVTAETVNGSIESEYPLTVTGKFGPREVKGTINGGGPTLSLETVNGSIRIRKPK